MTEDEVGQRPDKNDPRAAHTNRDLHSIVKRVHASYLKPVQF